MMLLKFSVKSKDIETQKLCKLPKVTELVTGLVSSGGIDKGS